MDSQLTRTGHSDCEKLSSDKCSRFLVPRESQIVKTTSCLILKHNKINSSKLQHSLTTYCVPGPMVSTKPHPRRYKNEKAHFISSRSFPADGVSGSLQLQVCVHACGLRRLEIGRSIISIQCGKCTSNITYKTSSGPEAEEVRRKDRGSDIWVEF